MNKLVLGFQSISLALDGSLQPFYEETEARVAAKICASVVPKLHNMTTCASSLRRGGVDKFTSLGR